MGLLLSCDRRIPDQVADLRRKVEQGGVPKARGLHGRTMALSAWVDRPGGGPAGAGLRNAGGGLVAEPDP